MGPLLKLVGLSCRHFAGLCSAELDHPLRRRERFRYRLHLAMCRLCRSLPSQFAVLRAYLKDCGEFLTGSTEGGQPGAATGDNEQAARLEPECALLNEEASIRIRRRLESAVAAESADPDDA